MTTKQYKSDRVTIVRNISFSNLEYHIPLIIEEINNLNILGNLKNSYLILELIDNNKIIKIQFNRLTNKNSLADNYKLINTTIDSVKRELNKLENNIETTGTVIHSDTLEDLLNKILNKTDVIKISSIK